MKKLLITLMLIVSAATAVGIQAQPVFAKTKPIVAKTVKSKAKTNVKINVKSKAQTNIKASVKTTMKWDASALKIINSPSAFDRNSAIRNFYIKKVENYAKRNNIKLITAKVVNGMRE